MKSPDLHMVPNTFRHNLTRLVEGVAGEFLWIILLTRAQISGHTPECVSVASGTGFCDPIKERDLGVIGDSSLRTLNRCSTVPRR